MRFAALSLAAPPAGLMLTAYPCDAEDAPPLVNAMVNMYWIASEVGVPWRVAVGVVVF